jgi:single-stranded-DNA-specific exonuclease
MTVTSGSTIRWNISCQASSLATDGILRPADLIRRLLEQRGFQTQEEQEHFLRPRLKDLCDPLRLPDMPQAVARVKKALGRNENILIYSDYDVDGMSSSALLYRFLIKLGARVSVFIPERLSEGYGLSLIGLQRALLGGKPDLLIALDCGTTSVEAVTSLRGQGIDVMILDHHELPEGGLPPAQIVVNPQRGTEDHYLATAGIVFKFCHAFLKMEQREDLFDLKEHLDFVALGTVADLVPLEKDNRIMVRYGLEQMAATSHVGLKALMQAAGVRSAPSPSTVGYMLGPRLNASGRLAEALSGWKLLTTFDPLQASGIAKELDALNRERQRLEMAVVEEALLMVEALPQEQKKCCIVIASRNWHQGVIGIVASRLQRKNNLPCIVISIDEKGHGKGSGRSLPGCSMMDALRANSSYLSGFGGHPMAAGLEIEEKNIELFRESMNHWVEEEISKDVFVPSLAINMQMPGRSLTDEFARELQKLEPFGKQNESPVFCVNEVRVIGSPKFFGNNHIRFRAESEGNQFNIVAFGLASEALPSGPFELAGHWEIDDFNNRPSFRALAWR